MGPHRFGLMSKTVLDSDDAKEFMKEKEIMKTYDISRESLTVFQDFADDFKISIDECMLEMKEMAGKDRIPLTGVCPLYAQKTCNYNWHASTHD